MPDEIFDVNSTFASMGLRDSVLKGVTELGFEHPTDIQARLIPAILAGKDVIGQAKTGTGKTAAFGLPILHRADKDIQMQALILTPTRELAAQVASELEDLGKFTPIRTTCIIGGESMRDQQKSVARGGHIIVGTPGRIMDMQSRRQINFDEVRFAVLDEVDRMLDIGFREDIRKILGLIKRDHQTIFVSATIHDEIEKLARRYLKSDAEKIVTVSGSLTVSLVDQRHLTVEPWDKKHMLLHLLKHEQPDTTVVFCRTKATVDKLTKYLKDKGVDARAIHGDMPQVKRTKVMNSMRQGKLDVLIASDLAARGLDVEHISHVINYDLPDDPEVYVHRIGRTARAGRRGTAWTFITTEEGQRLTEIEKLTGAMIEKIDVEGFTPGPVPQDIAQERARRPAKVDPADHLARRAGTPGVPKGAPAGTGAFEGMSEEQLRAMFPDGNIPKQLPKSTLGSRMRTRRSR